MRRITILACVWFCSFSMLFSQESDSAFVETFNQSTLLGVGKAFLSDSYLSPLTYSGVSMTLMHDRIKGSPHLNGNMLLQQQFQIQTAITKNPTASASEYYGDINYHLNGFYPLLRTTNFRLFGGGGFDASLGGIYNVRNSNNPGSLKTSVNLHLAAMALYNWKAITLRWQLSTPFAGVFFSPEYGHSYYEIFTLGNNKGTVHFGSFHNQLALRNYFTVDVPLNRITLRAGYLGGYYRTDVNQLSTKIVSHQFMFGLAAESINFGGKRARRTPSIKSIYY
ncbi:MAG: DUF3316 domain-containing protein [Proteiniphilum sp.]|nr:DUF3316 domain-containing protein [Proteiniphilum sp.]